MIYRLSVISLIIVLLFSYAPAFAPDVCVVDTLDVTDIRGTVVSRGSGGDQPFPGIVVELHKDNDIGPLISEVNTDGNGQFKFDHIRAGKYALLVYPKYTSGLGAVYVPLKLNKRRKSRMPQQEIFIAWGGRPPCYGEPQVRKVLA